MVKFQFILSGGRDFFSSLWLLGFSAQQVNGMAFMPQFVQFRIQDGDRWHYRKLTMTLFAEHADTKSKPNFFIRMGSQCGNAFAEQDSFPQLPFSKIQDGGVKETKLSPKVQISTFQNDYRSIIAIIHTSYIREEIVPLRCVKNYFRNVRYQVFLDPLQRGLKKPNTLDLLHRISPK